VNDLRPGNQTEVHTTTIELNIMEYQLNNYKLGSSRDIPKLPL